MTANERERLEVQYGLKFDIGGEPPSLTAIEAARRKASLDRGRLARWQSVCDRTVQAGGWIVYASIAAGVVAFIVSAPFVANMATAIATAIFAVMAWAVVHAVPVAIVMVADAWIKVDKRLAEVCLDLLVLAPLSEDRYPRQANQWQRWLREQASIHGYNASLVAMGRKPVMGEWGAARLWVQEGRSFTSAPERRFGT